MTTSPEAVKVIAEFEGDRLTPYNDLSGNATEGVGHLMHAGPLAPGENQPETLEKSLADFAEDLKVKAEKYIPILVRVPLTQGQYDCLISFTFNLGCGTLQHLVSVTGLNRRNYSAVPTAILEYDKAHVNGQLVAVPGLTRRREWEVSQWGKNANSENG